ncbi:hypothetical protein VPH35_049158 [Triticum aestivum]
MGSICWVPLLFLAMFSALATSNTHETDDNLTLRCHPDQAASLLQLNNSSGYVTALELSGRGLYSQGLDPAIFNLTSLPLLDLSLNNFGQCNLPATGFERLSLLTDPNLSNSAFQGQISANLPTLSPCKVQLLIIQHLDLSVLYYAASDDSLNGHGTRIPGVTSWLWLQDPKFQILIGNINNLRELYLDGVDMSSSADDWCNAFSKSLPDLRVLSLRYCNLVGPICPSLSPLNSLAAISLQDNFDTSATPPLEMLMDSHNLSFLQLAWKNIQRWFPSRIFQYKN